MEGMNYEEMFSFINGIISDFEKIKTEVESDITLLKETKQKLEDETNKNNQSKFNIDHDSIKQITNADTLRQMLAQCEDEIMRLAKNAGSCNYWPREAEELVREVLITRAYILNHMFALHCTPAEVRRFEEVNNAMLKLETVFHNWHNFLQDQFSAIRGLDGESFQLDTYLNGSIDEETPIYTMEEDSYYKSHWREMLDAISENSEIKAISNHSSNLEDGVSWAEGPLCIPQLEHICVCHLIHALCTHLHYSIPDILRMTTYRIDYSMDCSDFITLTPGEPEAFKRVPIMNTADKETIDKIQKIFELIK